MYFLNNTHFMGVSGPVQFSGADRTGIIKHNQQIGSLYILIGQFSPDQTNVSDRLFLNESLVTWLTPDGLRPSDGSPGELGMPSFVWKLESPMICIDLSDVESELEYFENYL